MYLGSSRDFTIPIGRQTARGGQPVRAGAGLAGCVPCGGLSGGLDPASPACPQPVHTVERDKIRDELNKWTRNWMGGGVHWHEGHPDLKAWLNDLMPRMIGLTQRPKLLRCSAEARKKALAWTGTLRAMYGVPGGGPGGVLKRLTFIDGKPAGNNVLIPKGGITIRTMNLRKYHVRSFGRWAPEYYASGGKTVTTKPPAKGSTTVGVPFDPNVGGAGGDPTKSGANRVTALQQAAAAAGITPLPLSLPGAPSDEVPAGVSEAAIAGIPTNYLLYGGLALGAFVLLKKK